MNKKKFNKGVLLTSFGSFWWGFFGVIYFKYISFAGHVEVLIHRSVWTAFLLIVTTFFFSKWSIFKKILYDKKKLFILLISGFLIFINWGVWIYAVSVDKIIDASFGYFIMPIISVFLGNFFFKESITKKGKISIFLVIISVSYLLILDFNSIPWVGLIVALSWSFYNLFRKKINVETDIGLLIESLYILPFVLVAFYFISINNYNDFSLSNPSLMPLLMLAGPMTVIPLFFYVRGVELAGLGPAGMIFYITPTLQFILGFFIYNEQFNINQLVSFILIWIAVFIYLKDIYEKN
ncbi:permease [Pelagibacteraceae bacterium GOM-A3]|nr:permease [Pelagibacteraceae bacterium GOM-A3]